MDTVLCLQVLNDRERRPTGEGGGISPGHVGVLFFSQKTFGNFFTLDFLSQIPGRFKLRDLFIISACGLSDLLRLQSRCAAPLLSRVSVPPWLNGIL